MYLKLKDINQFKIEEYVGKYYGRWNEAERKYEKSDTPQVGYSPKWTFKVDNGAQLDLSQDQLSQVLVACFDRKCPLRGSAFTVKTNNKVGLEIRYYINMI